MELLPGQAININNESLELSDLHLKTGAGQLLPS